MKGLAYILAALGVIGLAFWAYQENYATQSTMNASKKLQRDLGSAQIRLGILKAEWAYLNRPNRLMELSEINFDSLGLLPLRPDQFGRIDEINTPEEPLLTFTNPIDVSTMNSISPNSAAPDGQFP